MPIMYSPLVCFALFVAAFFTPWHRQSPLARAVYWISFLPALHVAFLLVAWGIYFVGGCKGALGSGVTCVLGDSFGIPAIYAEFSIILGMFLTIPIAMVAVFGLFVLVVTGLIRLAIKKQK